MKKNLLLIFTSFALLFASCTVNGAGATSDFVFSVDESFVDKVYESRSALAAVYSDDGALTLEVTVTGACAETKTIEYKNKKAAAGNQITFEQIPLNKAITVSVNCYIDDELYYEAASDSFMLTASSNPYELSSMVKKLANTSYALYNSSGFYLYRNLTDSNAFASTDTIKNLLLESDASIDGSSFTVTDTCFDVDGNCFVSFTVKNAGGKKISYVGSVNKEEFQKTSLSDIKAIEYHANSNSILAKGVAASEDVFDFIYIVDDEVKESVFSLKSVGLEELSILLMTTNDDYLYIVHSVEEESKCVYKLAKYKMNIVFDNSEIVDFAIKAENEITLKTIDSSKPLISNAALYSDLIAQNDKLYLLYSGANEDTSADKNSSLISCGALYEYDAKTLSAGRSIDLNPANVTYSKFNTYAFVDNQKLYTDASLKTPFVKPYTGQFTYYGPSEVLGSDLFGSERFVAKKPRKLVFADNGFIFTTSAAGVLSCKNVNRVVTVDLESFAVSFAAAAPKGINFGFDITENIKLDSGSVADLTGVESLYYKSKGKVVTADSETVYTSAIEVINAQ